MLESMPEGRERDALKEKLDNTKERWDDLANKLNNHRSKLDDVKPTAKIYEDVSNPFIAWLDDAEDRLKKCAKVPNNEEEIIHVQEELEVKHLAHCFSR